MTELSLTLLSDGHCVQLERLAMQGGRFRRQRFASMFALIQHPRLGPILFDTGYSSRFHQETRSFPARFYALLTPVQLSEAGGVAAQLQARGIEPEEVRHVILSHFHADHIGGVRDFPKARFHCSREGFSAVRPLKGLAAVEKAFLPGLLPPDFAERAVFTEDAPRVDLPGRFAPFSCARDLFGDGSILAVDLPGHALGQIGIFLSTADADWLLVSDACWLSRAYRDQALPHPLARFLIDFPVYRETLGKLHQLHQANPALKIIPSHCPEIW